VPLGAILAEKKAGLASPSRDGDNSPKRQFEEEV
jgi:hypothetical protein